DEDSYHGLPDPLTCPEDESRKSIALYYFTEEAEAPRLRTTNYRARPTDGIKGVAIWLDKQAIALYTRVKRTLGINDDFVSDLLNRFGGRK
ncbi:MAG: 2OG-Fe(II) oxygenase, partial [Flavobacteriales bacterium]|nr:2OG-Fe(II) oxygenase [Flavobacteriales bacterium]